MSIDLPDIDPLLPPRYEVPQPLAPPDHRGEGHHAPAHDQGDVLPEIVDAAVAMDAACDPVVACLGGYLWRTVLAARELHATARHFRADPQYRRLRIGLDVARVRLQQALREDPDDDAIAAALAEVNSYLPRREAP